MLRHGINTYKDDTSIVSVQVAAVGIPFYIGTWPCHLGKGYVGKPQLANDFSEAKELGGYSEEWRNEDGSPKWNLCQAMYAHFNLMGVSPAIFYNLYDPAKHKKTVSETQIGVSEHIASLPLDAIINENLVVKTEAEGTTLEAGKDYETYYTSDALCVELNESSESYGAETLTIGYDIADLSMIKDTDIELAVEEVEKCRSTVGIVPDLICAPGWSSNPAVAAVMAAKAPSINGLFRGKAVVDLDTKTADDYSKVLEAKTSGVYTSEDMIVCWPLVRNENYIFDLSVIVCALIAKVDTGNDDCPYESPSNKELPLTGAQTASGKEIILSLPQADVISVTDGVVTAINNNGWVLWGNYLGCYPGTGDETTTTSDTAKIFICTNRTQDWICNTFVNTFWQYVDKPLTPALRDAITTAFNAWLSGLTAEGKLYGGEIEYFEELNPVTSLMAGIFRLDTTAASPIPTQQIDMHIRYSVDMLKSALSS